MGMTWLYRGTLAIVLGVTAANSSLAATCPIVGGYYWALGQRQEDAMPAMPAMPALPTGPNGCGSEECRAAFDIVCAALALDGIGRSNSLAYLTPAYAEAAVRTRHRMLRAFGYAHPSRVPLYCTYLTRLAALTPDQPRRDGDNSVLFNIELAVRLWPLDRTCPAKVKAAFPDTSTIRAMLVNQGGECLDRPAWCLRGSDPPVRLSPSARHVRQHPG